VDFQLPLGQLAETVEVRSEAPLFDARSAENSQNFRMNELQTRTGDNAGRRTGNNASLEQLAPSVNVQSLQRRAAGVLPVRIDVPRAGTSHRFLKPLVIDEETVVSFRYKRR
jgi:hypothetical protein